MIVEIISSYEPRFPKVGECYAALQYPFDSEKVTLLYQVDPETHQKLDKQYTSEPLCNEYWENVKVRPNK